MLFSITSQAVVKQHQSSLPLLPPLLPNRYGMSPCPVPRACAILKSFHPRGLQSPTLTLAWTARHYRHHLPLIIRQALQTTYPVLPSGRSVTRFPVPPEVLTQTCSWRPLQSSWVSSYLWMTFCHQKMIMKRYMSNYLMEVKNSACYYIRVAMVVVIVALSQF